MTPDLIAVTLIAVAGVWGLVRLVTDTGPLLDVAPRAVPEPERPWWLPRSGRWVPHTDPALRRLDVAVYRMRAVARDSLARQNGGKS